MNHKSHQRRAAKPLDGPSLRALALGYVGRYATTRAKLRAYLARKLKDRGWESDVPPDLTALIADFAGLGYVDDRAFAEARGAALTRRGYGARRVGQALQQAGVAAEDAAPPRDAARDQALEAALRIARRRRIGPYATGPQTPEQRDRAIGALLRAGHDFAMARRIVEAPPGEPPTADDTY